MEAVTSRRDRLEDKVVSMMTSIGRGYVAAIIVLSAIILWGFYAYTVQLRDGLVVTGLRDRIMWGFYISNFVFIIGISYGGTLISAILRINGAEWRRPITRMAEGIAVVALSVGMLFPIIDLGRPDRMLNIIIYGRWQSPVIWDIIAISTYLVASLLYLFVLMIPDMAMLGDRSEGISPWRRALYKILGVGWIDSPRQRRLLARLGMMMAVFIIPLAITVHTVLAWLFSMNLREGWHSTLFGPFFVVGAVYSGIAVIIVMMAVVRKAYHLEEHIQSRHFVYLGYMLAALSVAMIYMNVAEHLTAGYTLAGETSFYLEQLFTGEFAPFFWFVIIGGFFVPGLFILMPWTRNIGGIVIASILVIVAMGAERYYLVVSGLRVPQMPYEPSDYIPTWVELSVVAGAFALVVLLLMIFAKIFPILPIWEMTEDEEAPEAERDFDVSRLAAPGELGRPGDETAGGP